MVFCNSIIRLISELCFAATNALGRACMPVELSPWNPISFERRWNFQALAMQPGVDIWVGPARNQGHFALQLHRASGAKDQYYVSTQVFLISSSCNHEARAPRVIFEGPRLRQSNWRTSWRVGVFIPLIKLIITRLESAASRRSSILTLSRGSRAHANFLEIPSAFP